MSPGHLAAAILVAISPAPAAALSGGEVEYMNSCAACHGADGTGGGPLAPYLTGTLPDLTKLSRANGGVFPFTRVYATIDGTATAGSHGSGEMPIWGRRYSARGEVGANPDFRDEEAEAFVRFRILALVEYLAGLQD